MANKELLNRYFPDSIRRVPGYVDSIVSDIENAREDILEDSVYIILNLCRVLACLRGCAGETSSAEQIVLSKKGGEWGLEFLPEDYRGLIETALSCYRDGRSMAARVAEKECFTDYILSEIQINQRERAEA